MKKIFLFIALVFFVNAFSQTDDSKTKKVDYKEIGKKVEEKESHLYYPKLLEKLKKCDSTLTEEEFFYAYHGAVTQKNYAPYEITDSEKNYQKVLKDKGIDNKELTPLLENYVNDNPTNLESTFLLLINYEKTGNLQKQKQLAFIFNGLLIAVLSSGKGDSCENSMNVNRIGDEYVIVNILGFESVSQSLVNGKAGSECDFLRFAKNERNMEGLYFNVSHMFEHMMEGFK